MFLDYFFGGELQSCGRMDFHGDVHGDGSDGDGDVDDDDDGDDDDDDDDVDDDDDEDGDDDDDDDDDDGDGDGDVHDHYDGGYDDDGGGDDDSSFLFVCLFELLRMLDYWDMSFACLNRDTGPNLSLVCRMWLSGSQ